MIQVMWAEVPDLSEGRSFYAAGIIGSHGGGAVGRGDRLGKGRGHRWPTTVRCLEETRTKSGSGVGCGKAMGRGASTGFGVTNE